MKMKDTIVNVSLQVIPVSKEIDPYLLVDRAIDIIRESGIKYRVCPMETVMEGRYDEIMSLIKRAQEAVISAGAEKVLSAIKIEWSATSDISMEEKTMKYTG